MTRDRTDYASDRGYPVDDPRFMSDLGFARNRTYEQPSGVCVRPPSTATTRSGGYRNEVKGKNLIDVLHRSDGKIVTCPGTSMEPLPIRSGTRTFRGVKRNKKQTALYVHYVCDCSAEGYLRTDAWRVASYDAGCRSCARSKVQMQQRPSYPLAPLTEHGREAMRMDTLTRLPYDGKVAR